VNGKVPSSMPFIVTKASLSGIRLRSQRKLGLASPPASCQDVGVSFSGMAFSGGFRLKK